MSEIKTSTAWTYSYLFEVSTMFVSFYPFVNSNSHGDAILIKYFVPVTKADFNLTLKLDFSKLTLVLDTCI